MGRRLGTLVGLIALAAVSVSTPRLPVRYADLSGVWMTESEWLGESLELRRTGADTYAATFQPDRPHLVPSIHRTAVLRDGILQMDSPIYSPGAVRDRLVPVLTPAGLTLAADPRGGDVLVRARSADRWRR